MKSLFLCHHTPYLDEVRTIADELSVRGVVPWVATDGGFSFGDVAEDRARRVIREDCFGLALYATPGALKRPFIQRVELDEAIAVKRSRPDFVLAAILRKTSFAAVATASASFLDHDLTQYIGADFTAADRIHASRFARSILAARVRAMPRMSVVPLQFSTRELLPDEPGDLLRVNAVPLLDRRGLVAWPIVAAGLDDVRSEVSAHQGRPLLRVHGSRDLVGGFVFGHAFRRANGFEFEMRVRDGWWTTLDGPDATLKLERVRSGPSRASSLAVSLTTTDKRPAVAIRAESVTAAILDLEAHAPGRGMSNAEAVGLARRIREAIIDAVDDSGATRVSLYAAIPMGLAMLVGRELNALPPVTVHHWDGRSYRAAITLWSKHDAVNEGLEPATSAH